VGGCPYGGRDGAPLTFGGRLRLAATFVVVVWATALIQGQSGVAPSPPEIVLAVAGTGQAAVAFRAPAGPANADVTSYTATATPVSGGHPVRTQSGPSSPIVVTGLVNGVAYQLTVRATNAHGTGYPSAPSSPVMPATTTVPPLDATAADLGAGITWILPSAGGQFSNALITSLRDRIGGDGPRARLGLSMFVGLHMPSYAVDTGDRASIRAALAPPLSAVDHAIAAGRAHGFPVGLSLVTAIRSSVDGVQTAAQAEDVRNVQWYNDHATAVQRGRVPVADGWVTYSRYAKKLRRYQEAYIREFGRALAERMATDPAVLVAVTGDGETELTYERFTNFDVPVTDRAIGDYSPFAVAEFRDWIRGVGAFAAGQPLAGQAHALASRYVADLTPGTDDGGDGHTFNRDFGTTFTTWTLRYYDNQWGDHETTGALPVFPATPVDAGATHFDAPRQIPFDSAGALTAGDAFWQLWIRFRQDLVHGYNRDFAVWLTQNGDAVHGGIPRERFYSAQIPTDRLFGDPPPDTGLRLLTSASPYWTADITPYGGVGVTAYSVNAGGCSAQIPCNGGRTSGGNGPFFRTLPSLAPRAAALGRWALVEWNPSDPWSADPARYREENALIRQYRPSLLMPYRIPSDHWRILDSGFETGLRELLATIQAAGGWTPRVTWPTPEPATSGARLSTAQLNATADVAGTFVYSPPLGTLLAAPGVQTLSVTFHPTDPEYSTATASVSLQVNPAVTHAGEWTAFGGRWVEADRIVTQAEASVGVSKKSVLRGLAGGARQRVDAQVRINSFPHADSRVGVALRTSLSTGAGYSFVLRSGGRVGFHADPEVWGNACVFPWSYGHWYSMSLEIDGTTLVGKVWSDTQTEADATVCTQTGWDTHAAGAPGLNGGVYGETASFDNVTVGQFSATFNHTAPAPLAASVGVLSTRDLLTQVLARSTALNFDYGRFNDIMHGTAYRLVCANSPGLCQGYVPGTAALIPGPFYNVGTWSRDYPMTLSTLNDVTLLNAFTSRFAAGGAGASGRIATLLYNDGTPWYGAGGQGNPLDDDDSNLMFAIGARLGWQTVDILPYLNNVYTWIRAQADSEGRYRSTSHAWQDSFYPVGVSGPASRVMSSTMQGLYAVALRSLQDLGVPVPQVEIDRARARYRDLLVNGRLRAYEGSDRVIVSSLQGEALSLFIWNEPMLPSSVVQQTIGAFAEVYDASARFVGFKAVSESDGGFLPPGAFPVENGGAGTPAGDYQNGGSWMLFDVLALYAGARHDIPSMRASYVDRLVRRFAAELRAGVGTTPANKSQEFLCTAPEVPGAPCGPIGSATPQRSDYGWNAFIIRLLQSNASRDSGHCTSGTCGWSASPTSLRFAAVKAGGGGAVTATTGAQTVTVQANDAWLATVDKSWVRLSSSSGAGSGQLTIAFADDANVLGGVTGATAIITLTSSNPLLASIEIPITLTINQSGLSVVGPVGQVDTPVQDSAGVVGAVAVTGWAIDDVGIAGVMVYRACVAGDLAQNCLPNVIPGLSLVPVGEADIVPGARPDVATAFPGYPAKETAGFGLSVLTNMLPRTDGPYAATGGQGPVVFHVVATDLEGNRRLLSRSYTDVMSVPTRITLANDTIIKPFGTIDTPAQGATVSGTINNFGWVLTPDPDTGVLVPTDGSTVRVFLDGALVGTAAYNLCRGPVAVNGVVPAGVLCDDDVSAAFRGNGTAFRNLDAGRGAIGLRTFSTTGLTNGLHTLSWGVTDSAGRSEGIGSRYITVVNGSNDVCGAECAVRSADFGTPKPRDSGTSVFARTGFELRAAYTPLERTAAGVPSVRIPELGRVEFQMPGVASGGLFVNGTAAALPVGVGIDRDRGLVTWAPGPGFLGTYRLVFVVGDQDVAVDVTIVPAQLAVEPIRMHVDDVRVGGMGASDRSVRVEGWALDPQAWTGAGIGAVHVWAVSMTQGAQPVFLGVANLGLSRPEVAAAHGLQFGSAGFVFTGAVPDGGDWEITAYAWVTRTGRFEDARSVVVKVR